MSKLGVGVVGVGIMGRRHAEILKVAPGARLAAVSKSTITPNSSLCWPARASRRC
jgi:predicted dehydrogenase